jgi:hypothetical protein
VDDSIVEIKELSTSANKATNRSEQLILNNKKVAQKRPPTIYLDENDQPTAANPSSETRGIDLATYHNINKANRTLTDLERKLNEKLTKNANILEAM